MISTLLLLYPLIPSWLTIPSISTALILSLNSQRPSPNPPNPSLISQSHSSITPYLDPRFKLKSYLCPVFCMLVLSSVLISRNAAHLTPPASCWWSACSTRITLAPSPLHGYCVVYGMFLLTTSLPWRPGILTPHVLLSLPEVHTHVQRSP